MLVERIRDGEYRYRASDIGTTPDFERLVFRVAID